MAVTHEITAAIVYGSDKKLHAKIKGALLRIARDIRDLNPADTPSRLKWADRVMSGQDSTSYAVALRELALKGVIQDAYVTDDHLDSLVKNQIDASLPYIIAASL